MIAESERRGTQDALSFVDSNCCHAPRGARRLGSRRCARGVSTALGPAAASIYDLACELHSGYDLNALRVVDLSVADCERVDGAGGRASARSTTVSLCATHDLPVDVVHTYYVMPSGPTGKAAGTAVLVHNANVHPCIPGNPFTGKDAPAEAFTHLKKHHGLDPEVASNRLHKLKKDGGLGAADDVAIGRTGDVYNAQTGERLGSLTDKNLGGNKR